MPVINFEARCSSYGHGEVETSWAVRGGKAILLVDACEKCIEEEYNRGVSDTEREEALKPDKEKLVAYLEAYNGVSGKEIKFDSKEADLFRHELDDGIAQVLAAFWKALDKL